MKKQRKATPAEITKRLLAVKLMVAGMAGAMPTMAKELRREACETLDDLIADIG